MGETALDEETFREYLAEMRLHYTADKVSTIVSRIRVLGVNAIASSTIY